MSSANQYDAGPINLTAEYRKAEYALSVRRYDLALELMRKVLSVSPEESRAFHIMARAFLHKKALSYASDAIRESLRLNAQNSTAHALYAEILRRMKQMDEASREVEIALQINPANAYVHYTAAFFFLYGKPDLARARMHAQKSVELEPEDADYHEAMARVFMRAGDYAAADAACRHALSLRPENTRMLYLYGWLLLYKLNKPEQALVQLREALRLDPNDAEAKKTLYLALKANNRLYKPYWWLRRRRWYNIVWVLLIYVICAIVKGYSQVLKAGSTTIVLLAVGVTVLLTCLFLFVIYCRVVDYVLDQRIASGRLR